MNNNKQQIETVSKNTIEEIIRTSALRDRTIHIYGVVDETMALEVQHYINRLIRLDKQKEDMQDSDKTFTLIINSYGGSIWWGNAIIGAIQYAQSLGYKVTGICQGFAFSMAFDILLACDERFGYSFSEYMVHQSQGGAINGALIQQRRNLDYTTKQWQKAVNFYLERTTIPKDKIDELFNTDYDWFMLTEEALEYNVIHKILK